MNRSRSMLRMLAAVAVASVVAACGGGTPLVGGSPENQASPEVPYLIGAGDSVQIFVWKNAEVSTSVTVRPDGRISTPLVEDLKVVDKTPTQVARELEDVLRKYYRDPIVTVIMGGFVGVYSQQVRVIGEAANPQAIPYRHGMTLLDILITVGGITEFAAGDRAMLVRLEDGKRSQYRVYLDRLVRDGDISANVNILPGDILIIPESWF